MWYFGAWPFRDWLLNDQGGPSFNWGTLPLPHFEGQPPYNVIFWSGYGMYSGSKNKDAAWELLKFLYRSLMGSRLIEPGSVQAVAEELVAEEPRREPFIIDAPTNFTPLPENRSRFYNDTVGKYFSYVGDASLAGTEDFSDALHRAAADAQKELDRLHAQ